jgi:hypothetical protein
MDIRGVRLGDVATVSQGLVTSGRGAGARAGDWTLSVVSVGDIQDDRIQVESLGTVDLEQNVKTEKHLLRPDYVLVTARSTLFKAALVPPRLTRTVADATLLVVRPSEIVPGPYLWWYLTSAIGRGQALARMSGSTVLALSASSLAELELPLPDLRTLDRMAELVEVSERAYQTSMEAARIRRALFRDVLVERLTHGLPLELPPESIREQARGMMAEINRR